MFRAAGLKCFSVLPVSLYTPAVFSLWTLDILQTPNRQCENQLHSSLSGESMCSNGIPIHLQLIALVPFPLVVIDLLGMSCLSLIFTPQKMWILKHTADWICLQGSLIVADFFSSLPLKLLMLPY